MSGKPYHDLVLELSSAWQGQSDLLSKQVFLSSANKIEFVLFGQQRAVSYITPGAQQSMCPNIMPGGEHAASMFT